MLYSREYWSDSVFQKSGCASPTLLSDHESPPFAEVNAPLM